MNFHSQNAGLAAPIRVAVIVATKGRPQAITELLALLEKQSCAPAVIVISATEPSDIGVNPATHLNLECLFGPAGLPAQRNRGLERVRTRADIAVFFDDDFAPAGNWIEQCMELFSSAANIAGANGTVIRDGAKTQPLSWQQAREILALPRPTDPRALSEVADLYGCNMAFRMSAINDLQFDAKTFRPENHIDRRGRLHGNLVGIMHLLSGVCRPEKVAEL
jgi:glycosyltransferase involved in cell wall biosynthesis